MTIVLIEFGVLAVALAAFIIIGNKILGPVEDDEE